MATRNEVIKTLMTMAALHPEFRLTEDAAEMFVNDLAGYTPDAILSALAACRRDLSRFPRASDVIARIEARDGRPGPEEAWAMIPKDEEGSVVWTAEMASAYGTAHQLIREGDLVAARMAFKERYEAELSDARALRRPVEWSLSRGFDKHAAVTAVKDAVDRKRISAEYGVHLCPELEYQPQRRVIGHSVAPDPVGLKSIASIMARLVDQRKIPGNSGSEDG